MDISVTLFGGLRHFLPAGSSFNKCIIEIDEGSHLDVLLQRLPIPAEKHFMVIINDVKVAREDYSTITIQRDDEVVLLPPIKGG
ncbi:MoaD/ThiS family protein [Gammaproteobacteria bacterium]|nr:MoaD/ThiS family protein [Gammaproteobacteria bacterium]